MTGVGRELKFSTGGDQLHRGQWDGYIVAYDSRDSNRETPLGRLDWQSWKEWTDDDPPRQVERYRIKFVQVVPELRRRGIATRLYQKLFSDEGITEADLVDTMLTPEGLAFRRGARFLGLREAVDRTDDWEDYLVAGDAQYVPPVVLPQMPDVVARALAAGAQPPLEYVGAGMTGVVFCTADGLAYKVSRTTAPIAHQTFEDEAEWLASAAHVPDVAPLVAQFHRFDPTNLVIVRDCPRADPDTSTWRYGEGKLFDLHRSIEQRMVPNGWTAPEFKPDSYVITERGPVLVDASMPSRVGAELARFVESVVAGDRPLRSDSPRDLAFAVRVERDRTLSPAEVDRLQALIEHRWPGATT